LTRKDCSPRLAVPQSGHSASWVIGAEGELQVMPARLELSYSPAIDLKKDITYGPSNRLRGVPAR